MNPAPRVMPPRDVTFLGGDAELVAGLKAANPVAQRSFFLRYSAYVERLMRAILGQDAELVDAMQDAFLSAFRQVHGLRTPEALTEWLRVIVVGVAQNRLRSRRRHRWLAFFAPEEIPEPIQRPPAPESTEALRAVYAALNEMPPLERLSFALRYIEDMTVPEIARAAGVSQSTIKRRLREAERQFDLAVGRHPALADWLRRAGP